MKNQLFQKKVNYLQYKYIVNADEFETAGKNKFCEDDNEKSFSSISKKSSNLGVLKSSNVSEKSSTKRFEELNLRIQEMSLTLLSKLFECRDSRVMTNARSQSKKYAEYYNQQNLDFK